MNTAAPSLSTLRVADPPEAWRALGFAVDDAGVCGLGGVAVELGAEGEGIVGWAVAGAQDTVVDGLATCPASPAPPAEHPNGALAIDHVVVATPDFDRTAAALAAAGLEFRRVRDAGGFRQGFRRLGPAILEVVEASRLPPDGPARFWGLVVIVADLDALHARLGPEVLGDPKPAVQPGRRIATLRRAAGLSPRVAFMTPEV